MWVFNLLRDMFALSWVFAWGATFVQHYFLEVDKVSLSMGWVCLSAAIIATVKAQLLDWPREDK